MVAGNSSTELPLSAAFPSRYSWPPAVRTTASNWGTGLGGKDGDNRRVRATSPRTRRSLRREAADDTALPNDAATAQAADATADETLALGGNIRHRGGGSAKTQFRRLARLHGQDKRRFDDAYECGRADSLADLRNEGKRRFTSPTQPPAKGHVDLGGTRLHRQRV